MKTIHKFPLAMVIGPCETLINLPIDHEVLLVDMDPRSGEPALWILLDTEQPYSEQRLFKVYGTGHELPAQTSKDKYIGTARCGAFIWHVFEDTP